MAGLAAALRGDLVNDFVLQQPTNLKRKFTRIDTYSESKISDQEFERRYS